MENIGVKIAVVKWIARLLGFLACIFFLAFFIGEGGLSEFVWELFLTEIFLGMAILGYIVSWFKQGIGSALMMTGSIWQGIYLLLYGGIRDIDTAGIYVLPFFIPGLMLFIIKPRIKNLNTQ